MTCRLQHPCQKAIYDLNFCPVQVCPFSPADIPNPPIRPVMTKAVNFNLYHPSINLFLTPWPVLTQKILSYPSSFSSEIPITPRRLSPLGLSSIQTNGGTLPRSGFKGLEFLMWTKWYKAEFLTLQCSHVETLKVMDFHILENDHTNPQNTSKQVW